MKTKLTLAIITLLAYGTLHAIDLNQLPSPQRFTTSGRVAVRKMGAMSPNTQWFGGNMHALGGPMESQTWLYVTLAAGDGADANPDNVIISTSHQPTVIHTNGIYYITFTEPAAPVAISPPAVRAISGIESRENTNKLVIAERANQFVIAEIAPADTEERKTYLRWMMTTNSPYERNLRSEEYKKAIMEQEKVKAIAAAYCSNGFYNFGSLNQVERMRVLRMSHVASGEFKSYEEALQHY